jgi:DNA-directed RNA polymerase III subunit RPC1
MSINACLAANMGFSIGISDVTPGAKLRMQKDELVEIAYAESNKLISQAREGKLENQPGSNVDETLESMISGTLSRVRDKVGEICMTELSRNNSPLIMATCGSKGESASSSPASR